jgi:hypothetical protein
MRAETIDPEAFDLHCLAKTVWVVLTGKGRPPQGHISVAFYWSLSKQFQGEQGIEELDRLLDTATSDDPAARGSLRSFADSLSEWALAHGSNQELPARATPTTDLPAPAEVDAPAASRVPGLRS